MLVGELAMFVSRRCVLLGVVVLAEIVMVGRLMVMMRGGVLTGQYEDGEPRCNAKAPRLPFRYSCCRAPTV
jgi:hypothetical protein